MSFDKFQFRDFIRRTLQAVDLHCERSEDLLLKTAAQESKFGTYIYQIGGGPGKGPWQVEPNTERSLWENTLKYKPLLRDKIIQLTGVSGPNPDALEGNMRYNLIMARLKYYTIKQPLPDANDTKTQADYWKKYYNTFLGDGTIEQFIAAAKKYT